MSLKLGIHLKNNSILKHKNVILRFFLLFFIQIETTSYIDDVIFNILAISHLADT